MKCEICGSKIEETFLNKIIGTYIVEGKKKKAVCPNCQSKFKTREELAEKIK